MEEISKSCHDANHLPQVPEHVMDTSPTSELFLDLSTEGKRATPLHCRCIQPGLPPGIMDHGGSVPNNFQRAPQDHCLSICCYAQPALLEPADGTRIAQSATGHRR